MLNSLVLPNRLKSSIQNEKRDKWTHNYIERGKKKRQQHKYVCVYFFFISNMQQLIEEAPHTQLVLKSSLFIKQSGIIQMSICKQICCICTKRQWCFWWDEAHVYSYFSSLPSSCICGCGKYLIMLFFFTLFVNDNFIYKMKS